MYIFIAYFTLGSAFVNLLTLFSDHISYHCFYLHLLFISNNYIHNMQQYHNKSAATTAKQMYDCYDVCVMLFHFWPFFSVYITTYLLL